MDILKKIFKFIFIVIIVLIGLAIAFFGFMMLVLRGYHYEVNTLNSSTYVGTEYVSQKPLVYLKHLKQPLDLKGRRHSVELGSPQGAHCIAVSPKTTTRLNTLYIEDICIWSTNSNNHLKLEYIPSGTSFKVLEQYQLVQFRRLGQTSTSIIDYLLVEDPNGNKSEIELEDFIEKAMVPYDETNINTQTYHKIEQEINYIQDNGSTLFIFCPEFSDLDNLQELIHLTQKFSLENNFKGVANVAKANMCSNGTVFEVSSIEAYLMAREFSSSNRARGSLTIKE